ARRNADKSSRWRRLILLRWCDGGVRLVAARERLGDKARSLHLLDKGVQVARSGITPLIARPWRAHGLADFHEAAVHYPHVRMGLGGFHDRLLYSGRDFKFVPDKEIDSAFRAHQRGVLDGAGEIKVVGGAFIDGDAHAGTINLGDRVER